MANILNFPELQKAEDASPTPDNGPVYVPTSQSAECGHEDSMNRMPDPNAEWVNEESGEGKG